MSFPFFEDEASRDGETGEIVCFLPENDLTICAEATVRNSRKSARCQFYYEKMTPIQNQERGEKRNKFKKIPPLEVDLDNSSVRRFL